MKKIIIGFLVLSLKLAAQQNQNDPGFKLNQYFSALTNLKNFNGNVLVIKDDKTLLDATYNIPNQPENLKVNKDSKFIIASVSKVFIKFSILKLAEQNKLSLSDKLSKFIPDFPEGDKITVEQLMYHRSGLPRELTDYEKYDNLTLAKVVELSKKEELQFEPNTNTLYSNVGYFLLHYIINVTAKEGYPAFTQNLLAQMQLKNTGEYNDKAALQNFAWGFNVEKGKAVPTPKKAINSFETGNYYSTMADVYSFSREMLSGKTLDKTLALKMFGPDSTLIQAGGRPGYRSYFYKNLKTKVCFIFLSNYTDMPIQEVTADVINILDNKPYEIPHPINRTKIPLTEEILTRYIGRYVLDADHHKVFTFQIENGSLLVAENDEEKIELSPDTETTFFDDPQSKDGYVFTLNPETGKYDLTIITTGLKLTAKLLQ